jgi:vancomycin permeability regulator SanA
LNITVPSAYAEQFAKQSNEFTTNLIRTVGTNNQMTINAQDAARENVKIYNRTVDAMKEFSANVVRALDVLVRRRQQQFFKQ